MPELSRIPTPVAQHWRRVRYQLVPVLTFSAVVLGSIWLWQQQGDLPNAVGEVQGVRTDVACLQSGQLVPVSERPVTLYDPVLPGQVIARLDDQVVRASLTTLGKEREQLLKQISATEAQLRQQDSQRQDSQLAEQRRLMVDIERLRLEALDRQALIQTDTVELQRRNELLNSYTELVNRGVETQFTLDTARMQRDVVQERLAGNQKGGAELKAQREAATERLKQFATSQPAELETMLAPLRAAVSAQEAKMYELDLQLQALEIRSPIEGRICAVYRFPGQNVRAGDPIMTVSGERGQSIVSYVRQNYRIRPVVNMEVGVRSRTEPARVVMARVERIGPQVELVPPHQLTDPRVSEWGLPVFITLPAGVSWRPGELVDITFRQER